MAQAADAEARKKAADAARAKAYRDRKKVKGSDGERGVGESSRSVPSSLVIAGDAADGGDEGDDAVSGGDAKRPNSARKTRSAAKEVDPTTGADTVVWTTLLNSISPLLRMKMKRKTTVVMTMTMLRVEATLLVQLSSRSDVRCGS